MQFGLRVTSRTSLQIPPQPVLPDSEEIPRDADQTYLAQSIISPKHGLEVPLQTASPPPKACSSPGPAGTSCWNLDVRVAVLVLTLAGVVIVLLLYRLLQMRHRCVWCVVNVSHRNPGHNKPLLLPLSSSFLSLPASMALHLLLLVGGKSYLLCLSGLLTIRV